MTSRNLTSLRRLRIHDRPWRPVLKATAKKKSVALSLVVWRVLKRLASLVDEKARQETRPLDRLSCPSCPHLAVPGKQVGHAVKSNHHSPLCRPYQLNILDRNNIANAKVSGMSKDLKFNNLDYNNAILAMFVGLVDTVHKFLHLLIARNLLQLCRHADPRRFHSRKGSSGVLLVRRRRLLGYRVHVLRVHQDQGTNDCTSIPRTSFIG